MCAKRWLALMMLLLLVMGGSKLRASVNLPWLFEDKMDNIMSYEMTLNGMWVDPSTKMGCDCTTVADFCKCGVHYNSPPGYYTGTLLKDGKTVDCTIPGSNWCIIGQ